MPRSRFLYFPKISSFDEFSNDTMPSPQQIDVYDNIAVKNFSVKIIKKGLNISDDEYAAIYLTLEKELARLNLLDQKLNTLINKQQLQRAFATLRNEYPHTFDGVPQEWKDKCLTALAQKCTHNMRRRAPGDRYHPPQYRSASHPFFSSVDTAAASESYITPCSLRPDQSSMRSKAGPSFNQSFGDIKVFIQSTARGTSTIRRPRDLAAPVTMERDITVDDLQFARFLKVLKEDIAYNDAEDIIVYKCDDENLVAITNEEAWRAALDEMYLKGSSRFTFSVEPKTQGKAL
jgi:hypothetical protein